MTNICIQLTRVFTFLLTCEMKYLKCILDERVDLIFAIHEFLASVGLSAKYIPPLRLKEPNPCREIKRTKDLQRYLYQYFIA